VQPCFADNITDDVAQLHIHFEEGLLHVVNRLSALSRNWWWKLLSGNELEVE